MATDDSFVEVYRARGLPEAYTLRLLLEEHGITVCVDNELLQGAVGELPMGWITAPRILVKPSDEAAARVIVAEFADRASNDESASNNCLACGADMGELDTCPSCGWSYAGRSEGAADAAPEEKETSFTADGASSSAANPALWWEVFAVLAVGVFPALASAIAYLVAHRNSPTESWLASFHYCVTSGCSAYVVLFIIRRSGEPWPAFGLGRPRVSDLVFGVLLTLGVIALASATARVARFPASNINEYEQPPRATWEVGFMILSYCLSAFREELICRAYLITRLEALRRSSVQAVLISTLLFASYHAYDGWPGLIHASTVGLLYGCLFLVGRRVWPLAIGHALYNIQATM
jgi:membrane protease YdiL (CAAX protease family)